jgi:branched-chain amino acid transport system ATP-binding protein
MAMLEIEGLNAWYGSSHVLHGLSLTVEQGTILTLIGRNGAGKTSTLKAVMGLMPRVTGRMRFCGHDLQPLPAHARFHLGLGYVPEERRIVPGLTVRENLEIGLLSADVPIEMGDAIDEIARHFPRLKERLGQKGTTLSGGEQQMPAIARAMISKPRMILLDEPSEGIMPLLVEEMGALFCKLRDEGTTLLLVEQNVGWALKLADRAVIIDQGQVVHRASAASLLADAEIQDRYCAV